MRRAFTMVEVIIAVMIVTVVIASLLQLFSNNTHIFGSFEKKSVASLYVTLLLESNTTSFEDKKVHLDETVKNYNVDDELRRYLKKRQANTYHVQSVQTQTSELNSGHQEETKLTATQNRLFELSSTTLKIDGESNSFLRVSSQ